MSTVEYQQRIAAMLGALKAEAPNIALRMAQTGLTLLKERSIQEGITVEGSFAEYSDKPVYKSSFKKKALNSAGSAYASSGGKGTWGGFREAQGRKSDHVNLFYSGRMWTALQIVSEQQNGYRYSVLTGIPNPDEMAVLIANIKLYGNFLTLRPAENQILLGDANAEVQDIVNQFL